MQDKKNTLNYELYLLDKSFKDKYNLVNYVNQAQDFYNGKQYPTVNYKNMLRTTMNICSFSATIKASKIAGTPIYLKYTSNNGTDCTPLRKFDEYNRSKMQGQSHNYQSALNGFVNGTEIAYLRWDDDDTTYKGINKGGLKLEHIDLRRFAVANPKLDDIQNQKWVMFWKDESIGALKDMVEGNSKEEIKRKRELLNREFAGDEESNIDNSYKDDVNYGLLTLFTRFFRIDGEVYFMCSTRYVDIFKEPHPLSRRLVGDKAKKIIEKYLKDLDNGEDNKEEELVKDYDIDYEDVVMQSFSNEKMDESEYKKEKEKFNLYPFAVFEPFKQNDDFYGRSDITQLIPLQKFINYGISLIMKCIENNANGKILVKPEALQGQEITNEPSQVIVDYSPFTNGWGIKYLETQNVPNAIFDFIQQLVAMTRVVYGFNDVMDGSVTNQDMSGYMLQQMIKQSNTSIEQQQGLFWQFNVELAQIRLLFYKHYVDKAMYTYEYTNAEYEAEEQARKNLYNATLSGKKLETMPDATPKDFETPVERTQVGTISGDELYGTDFDISIEAVQGLADSKLIAQQMWDNLLLNGGINNIDPDLLAMYIEASPNVEPNVRDSLKLVVEKRQQSENYQLKQQLQELMQKTKQIMAYAKELENQNNFKGEYLKNLNSEFTQKINNQNNIISALSKDLESARGSAAKKAEEQGMSSVVTPTQEQ